MSSGWFDTAGRENFERFLLPIAGQWMECLQVGVYEGDASVWMLENLPRAYLTEVDPWAATADYAVDMSVVRTTYHERIEPYLDRVSVFSQTSSAYFRGWDQHTTFDFVYIDGDHRAPAVLADAVAGFRMLNVTGLMAFDDYRWCCGGSPLREPKAAVDAFLSVFADHITLLEMGDQVWIEKVRAWR